MASRSNTSTGPIDSVPYALEKSSGKDEKHTPKAIPSTQLHMHPREVRANCDTSDCNGMHFRRLLSPVMSCL